MIHAPLCCGNQRNYPLLCLAIFHHYVLIMTNFALPFWNVLENVQKLTQIFTFAFNSASEGFSNVNTYLYNRKELLAFKIYKQH